MSPVTTSQIPTEIELALELMPCQAMRRSYDSAAKPHPCSYFAEWGFYHSYDYAAAGPPPQPSTILPVVYEAKRHLVPEMLSGCRKAPILCVGINPNLPGWSPGTRNAIHPFFDDVLQYAHYFRYRTQDKLQIPRTQYEDVLGTQPDAPATARPLLAEGKAIDTERAPVLMYQQYQTLLDGLAMRRQWQNHKLSVGEDIAYANMVACPSARWVVTPNTDDPKMPVMGQDRAKGIVQECFYDRKYFLRQLLQSLPPVIMVFSRTTAQEFITALKTRFTMGNPQPDEPLPQLFQREIRLRYGILSDGTVLDARVIFLPHASARPEEFAQMRGPAIDQLEQEVNASRLVFNPQTGHLQRGRGGCVFCANALYTIGPCDYEQELRPLAAGGIQPLAAAPAAMHALLEKEVQQGLLQEFLAPAPPPVAAVTTAAVVQPFDTQPPAPPLLVLRGQVVTMTGQVLDQGALYLKNGRIATVQAAAVAAPAGFQNAPTVETGGVIYPGLLDLHNHLAYNILPLWNPPRRFDNRDEWSRISNYRTHITEPMETLTVKGGQNVLRAVIRYIEVKLLLGGVTSGQGMHSRFGGNQFFKGLVRNFEAPDDPTLVPANTHILNLKQEDVDGFGTSLNTGKPMYFHLSEGIDTEARQQYLLLRDNRLLRENLIGIHSLALRQTDFNAVREAGASLVWSPLSNCLLYGQSIDPVWLSQSAVNFGLGSDWTPSGSRNLLLELKVALLHSANAGHIFSAQQLAEAVTKRAAQAAHWDGQLGTLEAGKLADVVVLDRRFDNVYENLVKATERDVRMVVIGGFPRSGDAALMEESGIDPAQSEGITVGGRNKRLFLRAQGSPLGPLSFAEARQTLTDAMAQLGELRKAPAPLFEPLADEPEIKIELDMQFEDAMPEVMLMDAQAKLLDSLPLDAHTVVDDPALFDAIDAVAHVPAFLKGASGLRQFYT